MNFYPDLALQKDSISLPDAVYYVYIYNFYLISKPPCRYQIGHVY